jgi:hypothetical protein
MKHQIGAVGNSSISHFQVAHRVARSTARKRKWTSAATSFVLLLLSANGFAQLSVITNRGYWGKMEIQPIINPYATNGIADAAYRYDWGPSVMYEADRQSAYKYRMWWTRRGVWSGGEGDTIWYAESKDALSWQGATQVLTAAQTNNNHEWNGVGGPSVVKVGGVFNMFYEAPCLPTSGVYIDRASSIFLATSTDGVHWAKTYDSSGHVTPILNGMNWVSNTPAHSNLVHWFVQPSVFYYSNNYHLYYIDWLTTATTNTNGTLNVSDTIRYMTSSNATNWNPFCDPSNRSVVFFPGNNLRVKYVPALNKGVAVYGANNVLTHPTNSGWATEETNWYASSPGSNWWSSNWSFDIHLVLATNGANYWPHEGNIITMASNQTSVTYDLWVVRSNRCRSYPDILADTNGWVFWATGGVYGAVGWCATNGPVLDSTCGAMVVYYEDGPMIPSPTNDPRDTATSWDLNASVVTLATSAFPRIIFPPISPWLRAVGTSQLYIASGDYDGDGIDDPGIYVRSNAEWFVMGSCKGWQHWFFGLPNDDIPAPGDYDGDGTNDMAVFRKSTATWYILGTKSNIPSVQFGATNDVPIPADFNGDGVTERVLFRPSTSQWIIYGNPTPIVFGAPTDIPVPADYDGDGQADYAVWRPSEAKWYIFGSRDGPMEFAFGSSSGIDKPAPGDFDGDGKADGTVFRTDANNRRWIIDGIAYTNVDFPWSWR